MGILRILLVGGYFKKQKNSQCSLWWKTKLVFEGWEKSAAWLACWLFSSVQPGSSGSPACRVASPLTALPRGPHPTSPRIPPKLNPNRVKPPKHTKFPKNKWHLLISPQTKQNMRPSEYEGDNLLNILEWNKLSLGESFLLIQSAAGFPCSPPLMPFCISWTDPQVSFGILTDMAQILVFFKW